MVNRSRPAGLTLAELLLAGTLTGLLLMMLPKLIVNIHGLTGRLTAQIEVQREMRDAMGLITKNLRQASAQTIVIDQVAGQPPYSRIFIKQGPIGYRYWQQGTALLTQKTDLNFAWGPIGRISNLLVSLNFIYPDTSDQPFISVYICMQKTVNKTTVKRYETIVEKVEIMN